MGLQLRILLLAALFAVASADDPQEGKIWALLVAGSSDYSNYRHQADVCHAYQLLHDNGIPDENIVVMMYDDIANANDNPTPGVILNQPGGRNVYEGVPKDYTHNLVTADNFLNVLSGNKSAMNGVGSGKVIQSGPDDIVFVNFVDHGGKGVLYFPNDELLADKFLKMIRKLANSRKFKKMILYVEACHSGSMFDGLLEDDLNVLVVTAADPFESSYACYWDDTRNTYLGDVFSVMWLADAEHESLPVESIHHQFEKVRTLTNTSHVEEYGDLDIGSTKLKDVLGFRMRSSRLIMGSRSQHHVPIMEVADNMDVPVLTIEKKIKKELNYQKKMDLKLQREKMLTKRKMVDDLFRDMVSKVSGPAFRRKNEINTSNYGLNWENFSCYKQLYSSFAKNCYSPITSPYVRRHLQKLVNMCSVGWLATEEAVSAVYNACSGLRHHALLRVV